MRVYLAGPDVFFPDPVTWAERKRAICLARGLTGVTPFDPVDAAPPCWAALSEADRIARRNEAHIRGCDAMIANLTPFRGPSADAGTIYEVGFARALGRPVFAYTTVAAGLAERSRAACGGAGGQDAAGLAIEEFGLRENLMIDAGVREAGGWTVADLPAGQRWTDLDAFTRCVAAMAARRPNG